MAGLELKKRSRKPPPLTVTLMVLSMLIVSGVLLLVLYPQYMQIEQVRIDCETASISLKKQQKLHPMFFEAKSLASLAFDPQLPIVKRVALERSKISELSDLFKQISKDNGVVLSGNSLDINSLRNDKKTVAMELVFTGDLFSFRNCLIAMVSLPFIDGVESVNITPDQGLARKCFTKILINIDKK